MADLTLREFSRPPPGLFDCSPRELHHLLGGPSLISIRGKREPAIFLSTLLHGNETSGWRALQQRLGAGDVPERSVLLLLGNLEAARLGARTLTGQPDFNRIWRGAPEPWGELVATLLARLEAQPLFCGVDIHNNTGRNPHYSVLTRLDSRNRALAQLFSGKAVHVEEPATVLTRAIEHHCPAIAVEVGPEGDPASDARALTLLDTLMPLDRLPDAATADLELFRALARVHVRAGVPFDFADTPAPASRLTLTAGMEAVNFHSLPPGSTFGHTRERLGDVLQVLDNQHQDVTPRFFSATDGDIVLREAVVPAMYTTDPGVIRQDCLCYLMAPVDDESSTSPKK